MAQKKKGKIGSSVDEFLASQGRIQIEHFVLGREGDLRAREVNYREQRGRCEQRGICEDER